MPKAKIQKVNLMGPGAANGVGNELSMLLIGKMSKCVKSLPRQYKSQKKSWIDSEIFADYIKKLDMKFYAKGKKVALIIDNCPAHPNVDNLKAIELVF